MTKLRPPLFRPPRPPPRSDTKSYNAVINRLSSEFAHEEVLLTYSSMLKAHAPPDAYTFPSLLKACTSLNLFSHGKSSHLHIIVNGFSSDPYCATSLINFYGKFGYPNLARKVFDTMLTRDIVPWTSIIGCYSSTGHVDIAFSLFNSMQYKGIQPTSVTILAILSGISEVIGLNCLHNHILKSGFMSELAVANSVVNLYCKCGRIDDGREIFEAKNERDIVSWNSLVSGYSSIGDIREIMKLIHRMKIKGVDPNQQTFLSLISAISKQNDLRMGKSVHGHILTVGLKLDAQIVTLLVVMYLKCGDSDNAFSIFEMTLHKDVILWTSMISGLVQNGCSDKALEIFRLMLISGHKPSTATLASILAACAQTGSFILGTSIHGYIFRQRIPIDIPTQNSLITMYSKCSSLQQSLFVFDAMVDRDTVSWNAIVAGHAQNGHFDRALRLFNEMRKSLQEPDSITVLSLLQACASIGAYHHGKWLHSFVIKSSCIKPCILIDTALVDMYSKCGDLSNARKCFEKMPNRDLISWSTIIQGYGSHGRGKGALDIFHDFLLTGIKPNHVVFLSILYACSHNGLIEKGLSLFRSMKEEYKIEPKLEHCACVVDLLSRARRVKEAYEFYKNEFKEPNFDVLGMIVDACREIGDFEFGDVVLKEMESLKPVDAGNYVQLAHGYASMEKWEGVGEAWTRMRSLGLKKVPGWSSIEIHGVIDVFFNDHGAHPRYEDIVFVLNFLRSEFGDFKENLNGGEFYMEFI